MPTWSAVADDVASSACSALSGRMSGRKQLIELRLELGGRFPRCAATWVVDPQAASMAVQLTRTRIRQALAWQPVPFEGVVRVVASGAGPGKILCERTVRVERDG